MCHQDNLYTPGSPIRQLLIKPRRSTSGATSVGPARLCCTMCKKLPIKEKCMPVSSMAFAIRGTGVNGY